MSDNRDKCRVCLKQAKTGSLISLFDKEFRAAVNIYEITGIKIQELLDDLPNQICKICCEALTKAVEIKNLCIESDIILRNHLTDIASIKHSDNADDQKYIETLEVERLDEKLLHNVDDELNWTEEIEPLDKTTCLQVRRRRKKDDKEQCPTCGNFYSSGYIATHNKTHSTIDLAVSSYRCDFCGSTFQLKIYLLHHMKRSHVQRKKHLCEHCSLTFAKPHLLKEHISKIHTKEYSFKCPYENCPKQFYRRTTLNAHVRIHRADYKYECKFCGRKFIHFSDHKRHELAHMGQKAYTCKTCLKGFVKKYQLVNHENEDHCIIKHTTN